MDDHGYIKLHRKLLTWEWYDDANTLRVFLHLLLKANHEPHRWHGLVIERGQVISSYGQLAKELKLTTKIVRTAISHLKWTGEVAHRGHTHFGLFTIQNYNQYQTTGSPVGTQRAHRGHTEGNTIKNDKNEKNISNEIAAAPFGNEKINKILEALKIHIGIDAFASTRLQERNFGKHLATLFAKLGKKEFVRRLDILKKSSKAQHLNRIDILYREMKGFIEPVEQKKFKKYGGVGDLGEPV